MKQNDAALRQGRVIKGVGGRYEVREENGQRHHCLAKGGLKHAHETLAVGDRVCFSPGDGEQPGRIEEILPRKNILIRPPVANLDRLLLVAAASDPAPSPLYLDKMIAICAYHRIETALIVNKVDQGAEKAQKIAAVYEKAGYDVFLTDTVHCNGIDALAQYVRGMRAEELIAFAGASGVGKSSLLNCLFPALALQTGSLSEKIARGKHTTRHVELYPLNDLCGGAGYLADTPGFGMLDFERFDFFSLQDLPQTFREFAPYLGKCRYKKCSHTGEDGCAIAAAVEAGQIARCRQRSYCAIYRDLKDKKEWEKNGE